MKKPLLAFTFGLGLAALPASGQLTLSDIQTIVAQSVTRAAQISPSSVIAIVDREGFVLGVWSTSGNTPDTGVLADAIAKAGTASFLSSDQHAFSSRTAGFIVQQNFPPNVQNSGPGPLVGVNFSNLQFSDINKFKNYASTIAFNSSPVSINATNTITVPQPVTGGLAGTPGGVPLFKDGHLVGGVGVAHDGDDPTKVQINQIYNIDEDVAMAGQIGYQCNPILNGDNVTINGFSVAYLNSTTSLGAVLPFATLPGTNLPKYPLEPAKPPFPYPTIVLGGQTNQIRQPISGDPGADLINGQKRLTYSEVTNIMALAANRARTTRAGIRLPRGQVAQAFITVVNNPNTNGVTPIVLGTIRTPGATMFSWDVAVQKARTAVFFSSSTYAFSVRAVGFLAEEFYPPGINGTEPGLFWGLQERYSMFPANVMNPLDGVILTNAPSINPNLTNGITIFPGGFPLYRNGVVIGAIGVSGDGVDQDDIISASGTAAMSSVSPGQTLLAPVSIRTDQFFYSNARLPYAKFPRNPAL